MTPNQPHYGRVVIKISGESLRDRHPVDPNRMYDLAASLAGVHADGVAIVIVVGGGNLFRGSQADRWRLDQWQADTIGMVATGMNVLVLDGVLSRIGVPTQVFSRGPCVGFGVPYEHYEIREALNQGRIALVAGGMGIPGVSTDVPAIHAAIDTDADMVVMCKHGVDGVHEADPKAEPGARFLPELTASYALTSRLAVMDSAALALAREHSMRIHVIPASDPSAIRHAIEGKEIGSLILPI